MEIAGNLRTFESCAPYLKKYLLDRYDCDVFLHTFDSLDHSSPAHHAGVGGDAKRQISREEMAKKIIDCYHPKKFFIATNEADIKTEGDWYFKAFKNRKLFPHRPLQVPLNGVYRMFYDRLQVNKLRQEYEKQQNIKYDYVVFIRPDVLLLEPFKLEQWQDFFDFNNQTIVFLSLFTKLGSDAQSMNSIVRWDFSGGHDMVYFGRPTSMNIVADIFNHFDRYFKVAPRLPLPDWVATTFEMFLLLYCQERGLLPIYGKTNYAVKRLDSKHDSFTVHPDRPLSTDAKKLLPPLSFYEFVRRVVILILPPVAIKLMRGMKHIFTKKPK